MRTIKNLIFEGGGVLGMAYVGALVQLDQKNVLKNVERVAGTSAGALIAMLVSLRYETEKLKEIVNNTNFRSFEDHLNPLRVVTKYGVYRGDCLLEFIQKLICDVTGDENTTFEALASAGYRDLKVFACDLNTISIQEFSLETTPKAIVAECVRASMSIPLFFRAWKFPNEIPNDHIFVDGGTIYNYPINAFDNYENTLGFFFKHLEKDPITNLDFNHPVKYTEALFKALLKAQKVNFYKNQEEVDITVFIDPLNISPTEFKLTDDQKQLLYNSGLEATKAYLDNLTS